MPYNTVTRTTTLLDTSAGALTKNAGVSKEIQHALDKMRLRGGMGSVTRADLSYANLSYANLRGADLSYANLRGTDLSYANLRGADLSYANLRGANLSYADLHGANLSYADLSYANLHGANLSHANLRGIHLSGTAGYMDAGVDPRGYHFRAVTATEPDGIRITAGCRDFDLPSALVHWASNPDALARVRVLALLLPSSHLHPVEIKAV